MPLHYRTPWLTPIQKSSNPNVTAQSAVPRLSPGQGFSKVNKTKQWKCERVICGWTTIITWGQLYKARLA